MTPSTAPTYEFDATGSHAEWIDRTDARIGSTGKPEEKASANAWASFDKALLVTLDSDEHVDVTVTRSALGGAARAAHTVIEAKPNSVSTVVLQNNGSRAAERERRDHRRRRRAAHPGHRAGMG